ncbi:MAG: glycosyltransferase [Niabella sp.]
MKIFGITGGGRHLDGASFHRIADYQSVLQEAGITLDVFYSYLNKLSYYKAKSGINLLDNVAGKIYDRLKIVDRLALLNKRKNYDTVWISRSIINYPNFFDAYFDNYIYDIDDAVWLADAKGSFENYCKRAKVIFAGNSFLYQKASLYSNNVKLIPTAVDAGFFKPLGLPSGTESKFIIGFFGTSGGFKYIKPIERQIKAFLEKHTDAEFWVMGDRFPTELELIKDKVKYFPWTYNAGLDFLNKISIGIMPLNATEWEMGKCSYKMLLYMACGKPVIVSSVGMNIDVMNYEKKYGYFGKSCTTTEEWLDAFEYYYDLNNKEFILQGVAGRKVVETHYAKAEISKKIVELIKENYAAAF